MQLLALDRIKGLFRQADLIYNANPELANRYIILARKYAMAVKIRIPLRLKRQICHSCKTYLRPGVNMRFRINSRPHYGTFLSVTCLNCGHITRYIVKGTARSPKLDQKSKRQKNSGPKNQQKPSTPISSSDISPPTS